MNFWKGAYKSNSIRIELLKAAVITEKNKFGDISKEEFKEITGVEYSE